MQSSRDLYELQGGVNCLQCRRWGLNSSLMTPPLVQHTQRILHSRQQGSFAADGVPSSPPGGGGSSRLEAWSSWLLFLLDAGGYFFNWAETLADDEAVLCLALGALNQGGQGLRGSR